MGLVVEEADLSRDRLEMTQLFQEELNPAYDQKRFTWCYDDNPFGTARSWLLYEHDHDACIGIATAFPRQMYIGQVGLCGWVLGDFCLRSHHRTLGPALVLQKRCIHELSKDSTGPIYDFPSTAMTAIYTRLRQRPLGRMLRLVKVLKVDNMIQKYIQIPILSKGLQVLINSFVECKEKWNARRQQSHLRFEVQEVPCTQEFSVLAEKIKGNNGICINRTAEYLNWKYFQNPLGSFEILKARQGDELVGYLVTAVREDEGDIVDGLAESFSEVIKPLLLEQIGRFLRKGVSKISFPILENHPWFPEVKGLGFYEREGGSFYGILEKNDKAVIGEVSEKQKNWFILQGDRDA